MPLTEERKAAMRAVLNKSRVSGGIPAISMEELEAPISQSLDVSPPSPKAVVELTPEKRAAMRAVLSKSKMQQQEAAPPPAPSALQSVIDKRGANIEELGNKYSAGEISAPSYALQYVGQGAGTANDVVGAGVSAAASAAAPYVPQVVKDAAGTVAAGAKAVYDSGALDYLGAKALKAGGEEWTQFKSKHPEAAANIEATANIGTTIASMYVPAAAVGTAAIKGGAAVSSVPKARLNKYIQELVIPEGPKSEKISQLRKGNVETEPLIKGLPKSKINYKEVVKPTAREQEQAYYLSQIDGIKKKGIVQDNLNVVNKSVDDDVNNLVKRIREVDVPIVAGRVQKNLNGVISTLSKDRTLTGSSADIASETLVPEFMSIYSRHPQTASGLLQARKEFDQFVLSQKNKVYEDSNKLSAVKNAADSVRGSINDLIAERVPDVDVKESLRRQSLTLEARDTIAEKAFHAPKSSLEGAIKKVGDVVTLKSAAATGLALGGLYISPLASAAGAIALAGGTLYIGGKALSSDMSLKFLGNVLKYGGKALGGKEKQAIKQAMKEIKTSGDTLLIPPKDKLSRLPMSEKEILGAQKRMEAGGIPRSDNSVIQVRPSDGQAPPKLLPSPKGDLSVSPTGKIREQTNAEVGSAIENRKRLNELGLTSDVRTLVYKKEFRDKIGKDWDSITEAQREKISKEIIAAFKDKKDVKVEEMVKEARKQAQYISDAIEAEYKRNQMTYAFENAKLSKGKNPFTGGKK